METPLPFLLFYGRDMARGPLGFVDRKKQVYF